MAPGGHARHLFRSFGVATAAGERTLVAHAATVADRAPRLERRARGLRRRAASTRPRPRRRTRSFRELARSLARRSADVDHARGAGAAIRSAVPHGGRVAVESAGPAAGRARGAARARAGHRGRRRLGAAAPDPHGQDRGRDRALPPGRGDRRGRARRVGRRGRARPHARRARAGLPGPRSPPTAPTSSTSRSARSASASPPSRATGCGSATCSCWTSAASTARCISDTGVTLALEPLEGEAAERVRPRARLPRGRRARARARRAGLGDVYRAMRGVVDGTLAERSLPQGHGLGLEPRELPFIGPPTDLRLADDVVDLAVDQASSRRW